jgi:uncharacterized iron-regulated protein
VKTHRPAALAVWLAAVALAAGTAAGCAASRAAAVPDGVHGAHGPAGRRGVEAAALPFQALSGRDGSQLATDAFYTELAAADAVCIGESHRNPHHHWAQLHLLDALSERARGGGVALALGMEMFQTPFQRVLDDHAAGRIDEPSMLSRTGYKQRWGYDFGLYRPIVRLAIEGGHAVLALNAPKELTRKIGRGGLAALTDAERNRLPELDLGNADHRAWFAEIMADHPAPEPAEKHGDTEAGGDTPHARSVEPGDAAAPPHAHEPAKAPAAIDEDIYTAQVVWDETMAETAAAWLATASAGGRRQIVILAGLGHCQDAAIVARLRRRGIARAVSVQPIIDDGEGNIAEQLVTPRNDYLFVMSMPAR